MRRWKKPDIFGKMTKYQARDVIKAQEALYLEGVQKEIHPTFFMLYDLCGKLLKCEGAQNEYEQAIYICDDLSKKFVENLAQIRKEMSEHFAGSGEDLFVVIEAALKKLEGAAKSYYERYYEETKSIKEKNPFAKISPSNYLLSLKKNFNESLKPLQVLHEEMKQMQGFDPQQLPRRLDRLSIELFFKAKLKDTKVINRLLIDKGANRWSECCDLFDVKFLLELGKEAGGSRRERLDEIEESEVKDKRLVDDIEQFIVSLAVEECLNDDYDSLFNILYIWNTEEQRELIKERCERLKSQPSAPNIYEEALKQVREQGYFFRNPPGMN